ncbi:hypothetical protein JW905_01845 [bacterium]|nr:hypothetical protein [candidate division CSSED10-310 bacterium]
MRPAWILLVRVRRLVIPLPWFLVWMLLALVTPVLMVVGYVGGRREPENEVYRLLRQGYVLLSLVMFLHGADIAVKNDETDLRLTWI